MTSRVATFKDWRDMNRSFESLTAYFAFSDYSSYTLLERGEPERYVRADIADVRRGELRVLVEGVDRSVGLERHVAAERGLDGFQYARSEGLADAAVPL